MIWSLAFAGALAAQTPAQDLVDLPITQGLLDRAAVLGATTAAAEATGGRAVPPHQVEAYTRLLALVREETRAKLGDIAAARLGEFLSAQEIETLIAMNETAEGRALISNLLGAVIELGAEARGLSAAEFDRADRLLQNIIGGN